MSEITFEVPDNSPCYHCGIDMALDLEICPDCGEEVPTRFTAPQLLVLFTNGQILDARSGGLVLGRDDPEDDIPMFRAVIPGVLQLVGLMHGGEFIVNCNAVSANQDRLLEINSYKDSKYTPMASIPLTSTTRVFNTNGTQGPESNLALLIQSGQFIVNRAATIKYYSELEEINNSLQPNLS